MARKTTVVVALLIAVGIVVAMLPAQESARRRSGVYGDQAASPADLEPAPAPPNLLPVESTEAKSKPSAGDSKVTPATGIGRGRRAESLSNQLKTSGEAASQEYTPPPAAPASIYQPAELSPSATAVPMAAEPAPAAAPNAQQAAPATAPPPAAAPSAAVPSGDSPSAAEAPAAESGQMRSVLKRTKTAAPDETSPTATSQSSATQPAVTRVPTASSPNAPPSTSQSGSSGMSSRRTSTPPPAPATASRYLPTPNIAVDTRTITESTVSARSPALRVDVAGPQGITVGKPAAYLVNLVNEGDAAAQDVTLRLGLPGFVNVTGSQATSGDAQTRADPAGQSRLVWSLPSVAGRAHETLRLEVVASEGQDFELSAEWTCRPSVAKATIAVKQAQLQLSLSGPADMTFGEEKAFTLSVANPGSGDAQNVLINLSAGENRRQQIEVGVLAAGQRKDVVVKIAASQAGEMAIHAVAAAEGGLQAEAAGKVIVRKAELAVIVEAPELKFAGAEATYTVTVQNTGNAAADGVQLAALLPGHAKYLGGVEGASPTGGSVKWKLNTLPPGTERAFEFKVQLNAAGANRLAVQAQAAAGIAASGEAETTVEAAANLKLVVNDPSGPLPTSELAVYQVQVMNRGSEAARQVKIVVQFGDGIEPVAFDGAEGKIVPGQVVCQPLGELAAGEQVTMRVKARADRSGTHQFRVEVTSNESEARLVSEGTTRFFAESGRGGSAASTARKPTLVPQGGMLQR